MWPWVFSALCLGWDLHLVFCASLGVPVLCSTIWDHSASYPKCHWAERHGSVPWGLMNINIITNLLESSWISLELFSEAVPSFEFVETKKCFCILFSLNLMQNTVRGLPRNTSWYIAKEGISGGHILPKSVNYIVINLDLKACVLCRFCVNLDFVSPILELSKAQLTSAPS